ncbi:MAG: T9SS type A sorting domain-containing protein [Cryomorphaceae bacterium]
MRKNTSYTQPFLFLLFALSTITAVGQSIDELEIIPGAPITTDDVVSIRATAWHPSQGCPIVETEFFYSQDTITIVVEHELGLATAICNSVDTTSMGTYAPGTYKVEYVMISGVFGEVGIADTAYTEFTVQGVNSTNGHEALSAIKIYPNPSNGNLFVETDWRGQIAVYDLRGKELENFRIDRSPFGFSTEDLSPGVYFLVPLGGDTAIEGVKLLVNE